jgi:hypothetical protein
MSDYRSANILNTDGSGTVNIGLKDNNPGDIKYDGTQWQGMSGNDGTFVIFVDTTWGLRAMAVDLTTKINTDGLNTITAIITAYAPPSENNTASYIASVASDTGFDPNGVLQADPDTLAALIRAIVNHEIGDQLSQTYVSDADITTGISMMNSMAATAQAAVIYAQQNPLTVIAIVLAGAAVLYAATAGNRKSM